MYFDLVSMCAWHTIGPLLTHSPQVRYSQVLYWLKHAVTLLIQVVKIGPVIVGGKTKKSTVGGKISVAKTYWRANIKAILCFSSGSFMPQPNCDWLETKAILCFKATMFVMRKFTPSFIILQQKKFCEILKGYFGVLMWGH